jgi:hypothetical protein
LPHTQKVLQRVKKVADAARRIGQFEIARQLYEEVSASEDLFALFVLARSSNNLAVLASRSPLACPIEPAFGIGPIADQYETLPNLRLPRIRSPHVAQDFTLYAGDAAESSPVCHPSFDELNDFGIREYTLSATAADAQPAEVQQTKPPEIDNTDMTMAKIFEDEDEEPTVATVAFQFKPPEPGLGRRRGMTLAGRGAKKAFTLAALATPVDSVRPSPPNEAPTEAPVGTPPPQPDDEYTSSLFL